MARRNTSARTAGLALTGWVVLVVALLVGYVSYTSNTGLPGQGIYRVTVDVPNATRVVPTNPVRIGGVRVGQVESVEAVAGDSGTEPIARLGLRLESSAGPLPADTRVSVGLGSPLGGTFVAIEPGDPEGDVVEDGGRLPLANASATVDLTDLLDIFDRSTEKGLRRLLAEAGEGLAGRGGDLNEAIDSSANLMAPTERALEAIGAPKSRLDRFVRGYIDTAAAVEPVAGDLPPALAAAAATFAALNRDPTALQAMITGLSPAEVATTAALGGIEPSLIKATSLVRELRPGVRALPAALNELHSTMDSAHEPLRLVPPFGAGLRRALEQADRLARAETTDGALRKLIELETPLGTSLDEIAEAQVSCNVFGVLGENGASVFGIGNDDFAFVLIALTTLGAENEVYQNAEPSPDLNFNGAPHMNSRECEAGNEPFIPGASIIGNPAGRQYDAWRETTQPAGVRKRAKDAGLYDSPGENK